MGTCVSPCLRLLAGSGFPVPAGVRFPSPAAAPRAWFRHGEGAEVDYRPGLMATNPPLKPLQLLCPQTRGLFLTRASLHSILWVFTSFKITPKSRQAGAPPCQGSLTPEMPGLATSQAPSTRS